MTGGSRDRLAVVAALLSVALFAYAAVVSFVPIWDSDIWWHLRVGEWIVGARRVPTRDLFSAIDPTQPWKSFNWLFQVVVYGVNRAAGLRGLRLFASLVTVAGYLVWARWLGRETRSVAWTLVLTLLLAVLFDDRIRVRPHLFNLVGEGAVAGFVASGMALDGWRRRAGFFALFWLWANLHDPGALFGAAVVGAGGCVALALARRHRRALGPELRRLAWPVGLAALAVVTTPYGPSLLWAARENITPVHMSIGEWQPVLTYLESARDAHHVLCALLPFATILAVVVVVLVRLRRRSDAVEAWLGRAAAPIAFAAVSLTAMRFVYLAVAPLAWLLGSVDWSRHRTVERVAAAIAGVALFAVSWQYSVVTGHGSARAAVHELAVDIKPDTYPESSAALIADARLTDRTFVETAWGGYVLWFGRPPHGVATDGRYNLSPPVLAALHAVEQAVGRDGAAIDAAVRGLGCDLAVLPAGAFPFDEHPGWTRVAHDGVSETFLAAGAADEARVRDLVEPRAGESLERAATRVFGARWLAAHRADVDLLDARVAAGDHAAVHERAAADVLAGDDDGAIARLRAHLRASPACVVGATELARALHRQGLYDAAYRLLQPAERVAEVPWNTGAWLVHLRSHVGK